MARAQEEVSYVAPLPWRAELEKDVDCAVRAVQQAEDGGGSWHDVFPDLRDWGADDWFNYHPRETTTQPELATPILWGASALTRRAAVPLDGR
jgi:hypothetical protein